MQQLAFSFDSSDRYDPSEFIESSSNTIATRRLCTWPPILWGVDPYPRSLILRGSKSCGKTYLAKKWADNAKAVFLNKTQLMTEGTLLAHPAFIIDGFDDSWNEEKTLHHFNFIHENNGYLLITINSAPQILLPDLASRLNSLNIIDIYPPDDHLVSILIFKLFSNLSVVIDKEITNYLINILPREFTEIITAVQKINDYAILHQRKITVPLVKLALNT